MNHLFVLAGVCGSLREFTWFLTGLGVALHPSDTIAGATFEAQGRGPYNPLRSLYCKFTGATLGTQGSRTQSLAAYRIIHPVVSGRGCADDMV